MPAAALAVRVSAQIAEFQKAFTDASRTTRGFEKDFAGMASSVQAHQDRLNKTFANFAGDTITKEANELVTAIDRVGGASKLTAGELARVNVTLTEAIAKYAALGQVAPKSLIDLEAATRRVTTATDPAGKTTSLFGQSIASLETRGTLGARAMDVLTGTFGKFTLAGVAVGLVSKLTGEIGRFVDQGAKLGPVEASFGRLAAAVGQDAGAMLGSLRTATDGLVSNYDLMLSANKAVLLGLPVTAKGMGDLAATARALGKAMGLDATQSLNDLITALGRSSPLILDNLGLTVSVAEANEKMAASLGKSVDALSDAERKQAFYNEAMEKARQKQIELGVQTLTLGEQMSRLWTGVENVVVKTVSVVNTKVGELISDLERGTKAVIKFATDLQNRGVRGSIAGMFGGVMAQGAAAGGALAHPAGGAAADLAKQTDELKRITAQVTALTTAQLAEIRAAKALGTTNEDLIKSFKVLFPNVALTEKHLKVLEDRTRDVTKAGKDQESQDKRIFAAMRETGKQIQENDLFMQRSMNALKAWVIAHRQGADVLMDFIPALHSQGQEAAWVAGQYDALNDRLTLYAKHLGQDAARAAAEAKRAGDIVRKAIEEQRQAAITATEVMAGFGRTMGSLLGGKLGGAVEALAGAFGDLAKAMINARAANIALSASVQFAASVYGLAITAVQLWIQKMDEAAAKRGDRRRFIEDLGGLQAFRTAALTAGAPQLATRLELADTGSITNSIRLVDAAIQESQARLERYGLTWRDLGQDVRQSNLDGIARELIADFRALSRQGVDATRAMAGGFSNLILEAKRTGTKIPVALQPMLETLIRSGRLSEDAARALLGMAADATPAFKDVEDAAKRYGIELDALGPKVQQLAITEIAEQLVKDFDLFKLAGADMNAVLLGMQKSVQDVVDKALKLGLEIPESMRPLLQAMVDAGLLTDLAGVKLTDLSGIKFTKPLSAAIDDLIKKLDELIDHFSKIGTSAEEGFGRARGAAEATGHAIPRGTAPPRGTTTPDTTPDDTDDGRRRSITVNTYLDGREIASSTARHLPRVLDLYGV